jgi:hypothetical protein
VNVAKVVVDNNGYGDKMAVTLKGEHLCVWRIV